MTPSLLHFYLFICFFFLLLWPPHNCESNKRLFIILGNSDSKLRPDPELGSHPIQLEHIKKKLHNSPYKHEKCLMVLCIHPSWDIFQDVQLFLVCWEVKIIQFKNSSLHPKMSKLELIVVSWSCFASFILSLFNSIWFQLLFKFLASC